MSNTATGIVSRTYEREWSGRDGPVVLTSFQLSGDKRYFRTGTATPFSEGDAVRFTYEQQGNNCNVDLQSAQVVDQSEVPAAPKAPTQTRGRTASSGGKTKENWDARGKYWENKEKRDIEVVEPRITFSAAQRDAISIVSAALAADALSFGNVAKGKQLDMILDFVDQVTDRLFEQRKNATFETPPAPDAPTTNDNYEG